MGTSNCMGKRKSALETVSHQERMRTGKQSSCAIRRAAVIRIGSSQDMYIRLWVAKASLRAIDAPGVRLGTK